MDVDQDLREFQRQYLDFLDDDVSVATCPNNEYQIRPLKLYDLKSSRDCVCKNFTLCLSWWVFTDTWCSLGTRPNQGGDRFQYPALKNVVQGVVIPICAVLRAATEVTICDCPKTVHDRVTTVTVAKICHDRVPFYKPTYFCCITGSRLWL